MFLEDLTRLEIACELGLYGLNAAGIEAYLTVLAPGWTKLIESDAFLRYVDAYLYFGVRILAGRLVPPHWWTKAPKSLPEVLEPDVNKRPFQLAVPPGVGDATQNEQTLRRFLDLQLTVDPNCREALMFLDAYDSNQGNGAFEYGEPAEFELWLKGLRPETANQERFAQIKDGLIAWARARAGSYMRSSPWCLTGMHSKHLDIDPDPPAVG